MFLTKAKALAFVAVFLPFVASQQMCGINLDDVTERMTMEHLQVDLPDLLNIKLSYLTLGKGSFYRNRLNSNHFTFRMHSIKFRTPLPEPLGPPRPRQQLRRLRQEPQRPHTTLISTRSRLTSL